VLCSVTEVSSFGGGGAGPSAGLVSLSLSCARAALPSRTVNASRLATESRSQFLDIVLLLDPELPARLTGTADFSSRTRVGKTREFRRPRQLFNKALTPAPHTFTAGRCWPAEAAMMALEALRGFH